MPKSNEVHAIAGSMVVEPDGAEKLIAIRHGIAAESVVFVISPLCDSELELASLLDLACHRDERLWAVMEARTVAWNSLVESRLDRKSVV